MADPQHLQSTRWSNSQLTPCQLCPVAEGSVRLVDGGGSNGDGVSAGILEVFHDRAWGTVCSDAFRSRERRRFATSEVLNEVLYLCSMPGSAKALESALSATKADDVVDTCTFLVRNDLHCCVHECKCYILCFWYLWRVHCNHSAIQQKPPHAAVQACLVALSFARPPPGATAANTCTASCLPCTPAFRGLPWRTKFTHH